MGGEDQLTTAESAGTDTTGWGYSLANLRELLFGCLDAIEAESVVEVGAFRGELTSELLDWAGGSGARIVGIDPEPPEELLELGAQRPELTLVLEPSHEALATVEMPDALVIDGDHNYYTLSEELRIVWERAPDTAMPLMMFHDVAWPHARRDTYYVPERIPEEHRQPLAHEVYLTPSNPGVSDDGGLPFVWAAEREGGPRNGTLTALEDFVAERTGLRLATVPAFFGFGALWHTSAPWAGAVAELLDPWDRNVLVARLEENRVSQIVERSRETLKLQRMNEEVTRRSKAQGDRLREKEAKIKEQQALLRRLLQSRAIVLMERLARFRPGHEPTISREEIRQALSSNENDPSYE